MNKHSMYLIIISGPTAVGKSSLALSLAKHYHCDIVSADSRQIYKELNIGTAKVSDEELSQVKHHFINHLSINQDYSIGQYEKEAIALLDNLFQENNIQIMCGGSGMYIDAVCEGLDFFPEVDDKVKIKLLSEYDSKGLKHLQKELQENDPDFYKEVDLHNPRRLIRALSVFRQSGKPFSYFRGQPKTPRKFKPIYILLKKEREELYNRINQRVDQMLEDGLENEVKSVLAYKEKHALQTVGYQEWLDYFEGNISQEEVVNLIKRNSRRYAKRQMTWFRRKEKWQSFSPEQTNEILTYINNITNSTELKSS